MLLQAILLGLVAMLGNAEYLFGTSLLSRPLVMGTLTGIVLGDVQTGVTLGATLELAFMGAFSIGASIPPEMISGTVLGTAFTITTGAGPETALTVGLPVSSLVLIAKNVGMVFILPPFVHKADKYAAEGNMAGVAPFGGYKKSGIGRETHKMMLAHYSQTKNIYMSLSETTRGFF